MRAIVTGSEGFIGKHLVVALRSDLWKITGIDDLSNHDNPPSELDPDTLYSSVQQQTIEGKVDAIFHLASRVGPTGVMKWSGKIVRDTVDSAAKVAEWALESECPLIFVSTSEIYGDPTGPNSETTPRVFQPDHSARMEYAVGKLAAETMLLNTPNLDVRIIRPFNVAGPGQRPDGGFVLPRFVQQALRNEDLTVYQPGTQKRAFTHVYDIVDGIYRAYSFGKTGESYNIGRSENECSILELADMVVRIVGGGRIRLVNPKVLHGPDFVEAADKIPDSQKAMRELGWIPRRNNEDIVQDTVAFWRTRA